MLMLVEKRDMEYSSSYQVGYNSNNKDNIDNNIANTIKDNSNTANKKIK